jgi:5-(carboxyamino)imidazole ribonucleotide mutase
MNCIIETRTGSDSDWKHMRPAYEFLRQMGIPYARRILSAHRTPDLMISESRKLDGRYSTCIAAAGGAAHLPGMTASECNIPVIGVPVALKPFNGIDSLLSIIQMPEGVPVGVVQDPLEAAINAVQIAYQKDVCARNRLRHYKGLEPLTEPSGSKIAVVRHARHASEQMYSRLLETADRLGLTFTELDPSSQLHGYSAAIAYILLEERFLDIPGRLTHSTDMPIVTLPVSLEDGCLDRLERMLSYGCMSVGVDRPMNAAIYCCQILAVHDLVLRDKLISYRKSLSDAVVRKDRDFNGVF